VVAVAAAVAVPVTPTIVSNNCEASVHVYLDHAGLGPMIQHIEARDPDHVDRMKPSPYLLDRATAVLGVEPSLSAFVGGPGERHQGCNRGWSSEHRLCQQGRGSLMTSLRLEPMSLLTTWVVSLRH
jgi:hypothetical protein